MTEAGKLLFYHSFENSRRNKHTKDSDLYTARRLHLNKAITREGARGLRGRGSGKETHKGSYSLILDPDWKPVGDECAALTIVTHIQSIGTLKQASSDILFSRKGDVAVKCHHVVSFLI